MGMNITMKHMLLRQRIERLQSLTKFVTTHNKNHIDDINKSLLILDLLTSIRGFYI